ncbi:hypothetical protein L1987_61122 [Smallanthus sonchifolius]|uniref:Uncharacterized protein n=1 Tax=Smallanthus sonchifolius TaxID=185202 RepID=A0ACB9DAC0_9ASTR|nr:hypothetical protein L1987_61122 [Smallanthus sonchifolius]
MAQTSTPVTFTVRRYPPELIVPSKPTPRELKPLSDVDDQEGLRLQIPFIHIYQRNQKMGNKNPASVIREALAKAEADVTLKQFGVELQPPFPCRDELLYEVPGSGGIVDSPLLLIQVTRLLCGGFILAVRLNHTMSDGTGYGQFMTALSEMANGASTLPVWQRELLCAREPPRVTCIHHEYDQVEDIEGTIIPLDDMENRSFFFGPSQISALRRFVPTHLKTCTTFEVLTASLWRCRTIAIQPNPEDEMRMMPLVNARSKFKPHIPVGYYGNVIGYPAAISKARHLCNKPLGHALELVMKAKSEVTEEYMRSIADLMFSDGIQDIFPLQIFLNVNANPDLYLDQG